MHLSLSHHSPHKVSSPPNAFNPASQFPATLPPPQSLLLPMYGCRVFSQTISSPPLFYANTPFTSPFNNATLLLFPISFTNTMLPFFLFSLSMVLNSHYLQPTSFPTKCNEICGNVHLSFPFHLNSSCGLPRENPFRLSCTNSTTLLLTLESEKYHVLDLFSDGILVDSPDVSSCRRYFDVDSFPIKGNRFYGLSDKNLVRLYDCEDSSVCKVECERFVSEGCEGNDNGGCCYPLSDRSVWQSGSDFSVFSEYGCRGFSSWVVVNDSERSVNRGIKLEWAVPRNFSEGVCAQNAVFVNATNVRGGGRCVCETGFDGDGFAEGVGCLQSCVRDERLAYGEDCRKKKGRHHKKKAIILAGVLVSTLLLAAVVVYYVIWRHSSKGNRCDYDPARFSSIRSFKKACRTRLFTYKELEEATRGFNEDQKLVYGTEGIAHAGVLDDGSLVAVQKIHCETEQDVMWVLSRVDFLSDISHKNVSRLLGCCIDSPYMPLVVYEFFTNGNLQASLHQERVKFLEWCQRISIATEAANALAYLQSDISPPVYHHDLKSSDIFLDFDYSVKLAGFWRLKPRFDDGLCSYNVCQNSSQRLPRRSDVYNFGVILLEIIMGSNNVDLPDLALAKISDGKLDEIVDPFLRYCEQPPQEEQLERVAKLAVRCLSFCEDRRIGMMEVAWELINMTTEHTDKRRRGVLEETFSTSSLLQMISMSPDSMYVP